MSADLWLEVDLGDGEPSRIEDTDVNVTYNLTPMLREAGLPPWREFTGAPCSEPGGVFQQVADTLRGDPDRFKLLNPANGWGTYEWAVEATDRLAALCALRPGARIGTWL